MAAALDDSWYYPEQRLLDVISRVKTNRVYYSSPVSSDAVLQDRGAVFVHGDEKLSGEGGGFGEFVAGIQHLPVATDWLVYLDGDGAIFVITQGNFIFHFPGVRVDFLEVGLLALRDYIEGVADMNGDVFVFGSVADTVFADE